MLAASPGSSPHLLKVEYIGTKSFESALGGHITEAQPQLISLSRSFDSGRTWSAEAISEREGGVVGEICPYKNAKHTEIPLFRVPHTDGIFLEQS